MKQISLLELTDARSIVDAARKHAEDKGWNVSIAVVDAGGHQILLERMDGAAPATARIASRKAETAAVFRGATAPMEDRIAGRPGMLVLPGATPLKGGVPIAVAGAVIGAVGISGLAPEDDHRVAEIAAAAVA